MLSLRQQVSSEEIRASSLVSDDHHFAWSSYRVDAHAPKNKFLSSGNITISRAGNFVYARYCLCAVSQRGDGLRTANRVNLRNAKADKRSRDGWVFFKRARRSCDDDALNTRHLSRQHVHHN